MRLAGNGFPLALSIRFGLRRRLPPPPAPLPREMRAASILAGLLTFYMTATGWATVKRSVGGFEAIAMFSGFAIAAYGLLSGFEALDSADGRKDGFSAAIYFAFGGVAAIAACSDVAVLIRRGVQGAQRIARHLWRMCYAMWMAVTSFFLRRQQVFRKRCAATLS